MKTFDYTKKEISYAAALLIDALTNAEKNGDISESTLAIFKKEIEAARGIIESTKSANFRPYKMEFFYAYSPTDFSENEKLELAAKNLKIGEVLYANIFSYHGLIRLSSVVHPTRSLAKIYWQVEANTHGMEINDPSFEYLGQMEVDPATM